MSCIHKGLTEINETGHIVGYKPLTYPILSLPGIRGVPTLFSKVSPIKQAHSREAASHYADSPLIRARLTVHVFPYRVFVVVSLPADLEPSAVIVAYIEDSRP